MTHSTQPRSRPWHGLPATGPLLRPAEAAKYLGICKSSYYDQVAKGALPRPIKIGLQATRVPQPWLDAFIEAQAEVAR